MTEKEFYDPGSFGDQWSIDRRIHERLAAQLRVQEVEMQAREGRRFAGPLALLVVPVDVRWVETSHGPRL